MQRRGLWQDELTDAAKVNRTCLSKLEKAGRYVGLEVIGNLADVPEIEPTELLNPKSSPSRSAFAFMEGGVVLCRMLRRTD